MSISGVALSSAEDGQTKPLWVISGVSACGKTTFIRNYNHFRKLLALDGVPNRYGHVIDFCDVAKRKGAKRYDTRDYSRVNLIEYNILKPFHINNVHPREKHPYKLDPVWTFFLDNFRKRINVVVFVTSYRELIRRVYKKYPGKSRLRILKKCYETPKHVISLYSNWIDELDRENISYDLVYCSKKFVKIDNITEGILRGYDEKRSTKRNKK